MIHGNLCVALLNSHLIFLAGIEVNKHVSYIHINTYKPKLMEMFTSVEETTCT